MSTETPKVRRYRPAPKPTLVSIEYGRKFLVARKQAGSETDFTVVAEARTEYGARVLMDALKDYNGIFS